MTDFDDTLDAIEHELESVSFIYRVDFQDIIDSPRPGCWRAVYVVYADVPKEMENEG